MKRAGELPSRHEIKRDKVTALEQTKPEKHVVTEIKSSYAFFFLQTSHRQL